MHSRLTQESHIVLSTEIRRWHGEKVQDADLKLLSWGPIYTLTLYWGSQTAFVYGSYVYQYLPFTNSNGWNFNVYLYLFVIIILNPLHVSVKNTALFNNNIVFNLRKHLVRRVALLNSMFVTLFNVWLRRQLGSHIDSCVQSVII